MRNPGNTRNPPICGRFGVGQRGVTHLFRFPRFLPICSELQSLFSGMPRFVTICSDIFGFVFRTNQAKPFPPTPFSRDPGNTEGTSESEHDAETATVLVLRLACLLGGIEELDVCLVMASLVFPQGLGARKKKTPKWEKNTYFPRRNHCINDSLRVS